MELVELLAKAMLYIEVESHYKPKLAANCKTPFSLLEPHVCSLEPRTTPAPSSPTKMPPPPPRVNGTAVKADTNGKRKSDTPTADDSRGEKRARRDADNGGAADEAATKSKTKSDTTVAPFAQPLLPPSTDNVESEPGAARRLSSQKTEIFVCSWNPAKPHLFATGSKDAIVIIWDISNPTADPVPHVTMDFAQKDVQGDLTSLHWSPDGEYLAIGSYDSVLRVCNFKGEIHLTHPQHLGPVFSVQFSPSGRWLLTCSLDGTAVVWDVQQKRVHKQFRAHTDCCLDIDWIDDETFASCGADHLIHIMKVGMAGPIRTFSGHEHEVNQVRCSKNRKLLATGSDDHTARVWDLAFLEKAQDTEAIPGLTTPEPEPRVMRGHKHCVGGIQFCPVPPDGGNDILATASFDGTARLWDAITGDCLKIFTDHKRPIYTLAFSPNGKLFSTGSGDGWLYVYDVKTREKRWAWYADAEKPGVFEIDWQQGTDYNRLCLALECRRAGLIDINKIPKLRNT
ncbi:hypothetical protein HGRIS_008377 [Hohenbuehelia grisea]|uniref:WD40 repeat-like protein n=1 Tax=Hohenbuehelia grisea TaxID=104357 RepID=A0ABR3J812_9AGAR